ncbi:unnamed protein product, partial [Ectocarpus fasciculatus]
MSEGAVVSGGADTVPEEYLDPLVLKKLANYLRSVDGVLVRDGIEHDKRVQFFKGDRLVQCLLHPKKWPQSLPAITEKSAAHAIGAMLIKQQFIHRSEKDGNKKGFLHVSKKQVFEDGGYYTWMFAGSMMWSNVGTAGVIGVVIVFTLLPIWPSVAKLGLWYLSVTFLLITFSFLMIRLFAFLLLWIGGFEFWIFPRLFDESLGVLDSFKPTYTFDKGSTGQGIYRITLLLAMGGFVFWAITQPTEFDAFLSTQREFVDDLYSGNLLSDVAAHKENLENIERNKRFPKIDQLLREMEEDEKEEEAQKLQDILDGDEAIDSSEGDSDSQREADERMD